MKKHLLIALTVISSIPALPAFAQPRSSGSFNVGPIATARSTWFLNKNTSDADETEQAYEPSFGYGYGVNLGSYFNDNFGIELDIFMASYMQKYKGGASYTLQYHSKTAVKAVDLPLVAVVKANSGSYFEIGGMYSLVNKANFTMSFDSTKITLHDNTNVKTSFNKNNISAVIGFGMEGNLGDQLLLTAGFRFTFGLSDFQGVDALGIPYSKYTDAYTTHTATGGIHLALKYMIEY
ncbi:MAG: PorT family protein [Flavobacteriales bacterium]|nr:PorT family protein [Flavobacteriales bacterium]